MNLREMIELAAGIKKEQQALAKDIGLSPKALMEAKAGRRGLPVAACYKLAAILGIDEKIVVAASELVTEKNPEKRAVFIPFVLEIAAAAMTPAVSAGHHSPDWRRGRDSNPR